jgi:hypothetical protein
MPAILSRLVRAVRDKLRHKTEEEKEAAYFKAAQALVAARHAFEIERAELLRNYRRLRFFVPPALKKTEGEYRAEAAAKIAAEGTEEEKRRFLDDLGNQLPSPRRGCQEVPR